VFVSFFQRAPYIEEIGSLRAYLCQAARRAALDFLRARNRRERGLTELASPDEDTDPLTLIPDPDGDISSHARYRAMVDDLCATVGEENTEIILSHAVCGESFPEIARRLGKKENTVKTAYHRAIKRFRKEKGDRWL
jgi:RNA polymerase sigma factor (sigma-70 family)